MRSVILLMVEGGLDINNPGKGGLVHSTDLYKMHSIPRFPITKWEVLPKFRASAGFLILALIEISKHRWD